MKKDIRNIWCAALNYPQTAKEVQASLPDKPMFFLKAGSTIVQEEEPILLPSFSKSILYELEVALQFNQHLQIEWVGLALDLTAWDLLEPCKTRPIPWTLGKSFKHSCPIGTFVPLHHFSNLDALNFELKINGQLRQIGNTRDMLFSIQQLSAYLCEHFPVCPYDLLLTGTPQGVSEIKLDDQLEGYIYPDYKVHWSVASKLN